MNQQRSIDTVLFDWPHKDPHLRGSQCAACGTVSFPVAASCPKCSASKVHNVPLAKEGTLWSWTVQNFPLASPPYPAELSGENFKPFAVGYVELADQVRVVSRLEGDVSQGFEIGSPMTIKFDKYYTESDGTEVINYSFAAKSAE
ncbi:MAG: Zn-ribbon domain-containing OB-fold protein [Pseudomonadales bacterium]